MIRIALADDHQLILDGISSFIEEEEDMCLVAQANNGKKLLQMLDNVSADVAILDLDMPEMGGLQVTQHLKKHKPEIGILILTMHNEQGLINEVLALGANGYVLKNTDRLELLTAIRKIAVGQSYFSSEVTLNLLNKKKATQQPDSENAIEITSREKEILTLIVQGNSNKEIGNKLFISHRTVDTHRTNLMKKLKVKNIAGLIRFAIEKGYLNEEDTSEENS